MAVSITVSPGLKQLSSKLDTAVKKAVEDCTADLLRVASLRTPVDSTTLEKSGTSKVTKDSKSIEGQVSFKAISKGKNYALRMDTEKYNLGAKSLSKSTGGVRSKFTSETMKVGTGYLSDTAEKCSDGYKKYVKEQMDSAIKNGGYNR